jgi:hypothetical protein
MESVEESRLTYRATHIIGNDLWTFEKNNLKVTLPYTTLIIPIGDIKVDLTKSLTIRLEIPLCPPSPPTNPTPEKQS